MIFVTVGTTQPFAELIEEIDNLAGKGLFGDEKVICQTGQAKVSPKHVTHYHAKPSIEDDLKNCDFLFTHGGATVIEAIRLGKKFVAVANPRATEDHQGLFLEQMATVVPIFWTRDWTEIDKLYEAAMKAPPPQMSVNIPAAHDLIIDRFLS